MIGVIVGAGEGSVWPFKTEGGLGEALQSLDDGGEEAKERI